MSKMLTSCFRPFCGVTDVAFIRVVSVQLKSSKPHEEANGMDRNWDHVSRLGPDTWRWWHVTEQVQQTGSEGPSWEWARRLSSRRFHEEELGRSPQFSSAKRGRGCWGNPWFEDLWTSPCPFHCSYQNAHCPLYPVKLNFPCLSLFHSHPHFSYA